MAAKSEVPETTPKTSGPEVPKTIRIELDGILAWNLADVEDLRQPAPNAKSILMEAKKEADRVVVLVRRRSARVRGQHIKQVMKQTVAWLKEHELPHDAVEVEFLSS